jgi:hypothetical protein
MKLKIKLNKIEKKKQQSKEKNDDQIQYKN